jgi:hypothetical protein
MGTTRAVALYLSASAAIQVTASAFRRVDIRGRTDDMANNKELHQLYGGRRPKTYLPAHNHVMHTPTTSHGERGFRRFWIPPQWVGHGWVKCPCGWRASSWGDVHYALSGRKIGGER